MTECTLLKELGQQKYLSQEWFYLKVLVRKLRKPYLTAAKMAAQRI
jgi:hypothetical protein